MPPKLASYPALPELLEGIASEYERQFVELEFQPGLRYYLARVDRLALVGESVLDAGAGAGQWSLALAQRFKTVCALDLKRERLDILERAARKMGLANVVAREGSIEQLPVPDASQDAVFCYGVIMFTDVPRVLAEFHRVLRPGGRAYVCLNADGWSHYLIDERGRTEPAVRRSGETTLYATYWARALDRGLVTDLRANVDVWIGSTLGRLYAIGCAVAEKFGLRRVRRRIAHLVLASVPAGRDLLNAVRNRCSAELVEQLLEDAYAVLRGAARPPSVGATRAYSPEEFAAITTRVGFVDFQWAPEGGLACEWLGPTLEPKYTGSHAGHLSVWECLVTKPGAVAPAIEAHLEAARSAARAPIHVAPAPATTISNRSLEAYPPHLLEHARWVARRLGPTYLDGLARAISLGETDEAAVRRLIAFVQGALFRDPVAQPLRPDGSLPEPLEILAAARGRCGHATALLVELARRAGFEARPRQFPNHVVAEVRLGDRWLLADADAFKGGVIPVGPDGKFLTFDEVLAAPHVLDRFPPTGWLFRPGTRATHGAFGGTVRGYVDALEPEQRGFVSGYYVPAAAGTPPALPAITRFERAGDRFVLEWRPSRVERGRLVGYRVAVGTTSRGWTYEAPPESGLPAPPSDVLAVETTETRVEGTASACIFASVTAVSDRVELEPATFFWPSEEARLELP